MPAFTKHENSIVNVLKAPVEVCPIKSGNWSGFTALWDTGAMGTVITSDVAKSLGLIPVSKANSRGVNGIKEVPVYLVSIRLPGGVLFDLWVTEGEPGGGWDEICQLRMQNAILTSENATDKKLVDVYTELRKQDKTQDQNLANLNSRVLALETAGPLKEQLFDAKIGAVYDKITCCCNSATASIAATNTALAALQNTVGTITKLVVPKDVVCPEYMMRYNSWTAPTTPAAEG